MPAKGSQFERDICRRLSLWWSDDKRDDLFWRTSQSGGRATTRRKKGKETEGHAGDITSTSEKGIALTKLIAFELKRGYSKEHPFSLVDKPPKAKPQVYEQWIRQAYASQRNGGCRFWAIIHKRDRREVTISLPILFLSVTGRSILMGCSQYAQIKITGKNKKELIFFTIKFDDFIKHVKPSVIKDCYKLWRRR